MFLTEEGIDVSKRVDDGRTALVVGTGTDELKKATEIADQKRSYVYDMYRRNKRGYKEHIGFGIPA